MEPRFTPNLLMPNTIQTVICVRCGKETKRFMPQGSVKYTTGRCPGCSNLRRNK